MSEGERRHEACRYGRLTTAWRSEYANGELGEPTVIPLCMWKPQSPHPPAIDRAWGGDVDFERDCALCGAFSPL